MPVSSNHIRTGIIAASIAGLMNVFASAALADTPPDSEPGNESLRDSSPFELTIDARDLPPMQLSPEQFEDFRRDTASRHYHSGPQDWSARNLRTNTDGGCDLGDRFSGNVVNFAEGYNYQFGIGTEQDSLVSFKMRWGGSGDPFRDERRCGTSSVLDGLIPGN